MTFAAQNALAKPFCSLRDPVAQIGDLFPSYTTYKSVTKEVSREAAANSRHLFSDLRLRYKKRATIYYVYRTKVQIGLVHVGAERGPWGLVEIAWAAAPEGEIKDYRSNAATAAVNKQNRRRIENSSAV